MSLRGYKPKTKPALWLSVRGAKREPRPGRHPASEVRAYRKDAQAYVKAARAAGCRCPVVVAVPELRYRWPYGLPVDDVHHMRGRSGTLLRDKRFWLAVSRPGHDWIERNKEAARELGFLCARGLWGKAA